MCQKIGGNLAIEICTAETIGIRITGYLPLSLNIGHCCNNKITLAYRANPRSQESSQVIIFWMEWRFPARARPVNHQGGQQIQRCYGAGAWDFWLIVFTNSIWLDSPSLSLCWPDDGLVIAGSGQLLVSPSSAQSSHNADTDTPTQS